MKSGREGTTRFAHLWEMASGWTKEEEEEEKAHGDSLSLCQLPTLFALASLLKGSADRRRCGARGELCQPSLLALCLCLGLGAGVARGVRVGAFVMI